MFFWCLVWGLGSSWWLEALYRLWGLGFAATTTSIAVAVAVATAHARATALRVLPAMLLLLTRHVLTFLSCTLRLHVHL